MPSEAILRVAGSVAQGSRLSPSARRGDGRSLQHCLRLRLCDRAMVELRGSRAARLLLASEMPRVDVGQTADQHAFVFGRLEVEQKLCRAEGRALVLAPGDPCEDCLQLGGLISLRMLWTLLLHIIHSNKEHLLVVVKPILCSTLYIRGVVRTATNCCLKRNKLCLGYTVVVPRATLWSAHN